MTAYFLNALLSVFLMFVLGGVIAVAWVAAADAHERGKARVMRGTSWAPKVPEQRDAR